MLILTHTDVSHTRDQSSSACGEDGQLQWSRGERNLYGSRSVAPSSNMFSSPIKLTLCMIVNQGMYALRERRQHVTQEDLELAVAKVLKRNMVRILLVFVRQIILGIDSHLMIQDSSTSTSKLFT